MPGGNQASRSRERKLHLSRRDILSSRLGAILTCFAAAGRRHPPPSLPAVLFEPRQLQGGLPTEYTVGDVSEK